MVHVEVIAGYGTEVEPAVLLSTGTRGLTKPMYLLNAPEGLARIALEHRVFRPAKGFISGVFAMGTSSTCLGDVASAILRTATDGAARVQVVGPPSTARGILALRHVMLWSHPIVFVSDVHATRTCFADEHISVLAVCLPDVASAKDSDDDDSSSDNDSNDESKDDKEEGENSTGTGEGQGESTGTKSSEHDGGSSSDANDSSGSADSDDSDEDESSENESQDSDSSDSEPTVAARELAPSLQLYVRDWSMYPRSVFKKPTTRTFPGVQQGHPSSSAPTSSRGGGSGPASLAGVCVECEALWPQPLLGYTVTSTSSGQPLVVALNIPCQHVLAHCIRCDLPNLFGLRSEGAAATSSNILVLHFSPPEIQRLPEYQAIVAAFSKRSCHHLNLHQPLHAHRICPQHTGSALLLGAIAAKRRKNHAKSPASFPLCTCAHAALPLACSSVKRRSSLPLFKSMPVATVCAMLQEEKHAEQVTQAPVPQLMTTAPEPDLSQPVHRDDSHGERKDTLCACETYVIGSTTSDTTPQSASSPAQPPRKRAHKQDTCSASLSRSMEAGEGALSACKEGGTASCMDGSPTAQSQLVFLGTGSAEPSRYRGSSGILVETSRGHLLLDAGAGVVNSMMHLFGPSGACSRVCCLRMVWLSHKHVDHALGVLRILELRSRWLDIVDPLVLVVPRQISAWLRETLHRRPLLFASCTLLSFHAFKHQFTQLQPVRALGLASFASIPVQHCADAHAAVIRWQSGFSLAYSGDCRPSEAFEEAARGVRVLIHEATFESALKEHAERKMHSTADEAVSLATSANCGHLILTHFSQRYPGPLRFKRVGAGVAAVIADDGMHWTPPPTQT